VPVARPLATIRLFCLPFAGGGASIYRTWWRGLPADVEVCAVQLPGHENRIAESPIDRLDRLTEALAVQLAGRLDLPYGLFGHSMGGLIAFELVRRLRAHGLSDPVHFFASGCPAPSLPARRAPIHALPEAQFIDRVRAYRALPAAAAGADDLIQLMLPALRSDFALVETYEYRPQLPLTCPVTVLGGLDDEVVARDELDAWSRLAAGPTRFVMVPGDHFFIRSSESVVLDAIAVGLTGGTGGGVT